MSSYRISIEIGRETHLVGMLDVFNNRKKEFYRFQYSDEWINHPFSFEIDPMLPLKRNFPFQENRLFGVFQDISPDRWGRILQDRAYPGGRAPSEYMIGVSDYMRLGAIRISLSNNPKEYLSQHSDVPKFVMIPELSEAIRRVEADRETSDDIRKLLRPGASLGGARPKAVVQEDGTMWIAKFPSQNDEHRVGLWELMMLKLAESVGIETPDAKVLDLPGGNHVLLVKRFDRTADGGRIPFMSAMTMLGRDEKTRDYGSYRELAEMIVTVSSNPTKDAKNLWKRMVFNALTGNTDDHLRNHGFLRNISGWTLSPAYDLNPNSWRQNHALSFDGFNSLPSMKLFRSLSPYFRYGSETEANNELERICEGVSRWKDMAKSVGLESREIVRMEKSFSLIEGSGEKSGAIPKH